MTPTTPPSAPQPAATPPGRPTSETDAITALGLAFKGTTGAVRRLRGRQTQGPGELSHAQYGLLFGLADEPELSASQLAYVADLAPATVTQMLDHLEASRLVRRVRSELDKRVVLVSLTDHGRELVEAQRARIERRWRMALAEFGDGELLTAAAVLDRLRVVFDDFERD